MATRKEIRLLGLVTQGDEKRDSVVSFLSRTTGSDACLGLSVGEDYLAAFKTSLRTTNYESLLPHSQKRWFRLYKLADERGWSVVSIEPRLPEKPTSVDKEFKHAIKEKGLAEKIVDQHVTIAVMDALHIGAVSKRLKDRGIRNKIVLRHAPVFSRLASGLLARQRRIYQRTRERVK